MSDTFHNKENHSSVSTSTVSKDDTSLFAKNINTLQQIQKHYAQKILSADFPYKIHHAFGRDGSNTVKIQYSDGSFSWFGGSSMPGISAQATTERYMIDNKNLILPSIVTGLDPILLLKKLPDHCALFICEPELWRVRVAFELYDYSEWIEQRKIIFIDPKDLEYEFEIFFKENPGYEFPQTLIRIPQVEDNEFSYFQKHLELAGQKISLLQHELYDLYESTIKSSKLVNKSSINETIYKILITSLDADHRSLAIVNMINQECAGKGWQSSIVIPDHPAHCHQLARLHECVQFTPDVVITINSSSGSLQHSISGKIPQASYYGFHFPYKLVSDKIIGKPDIVFSDHNSLTDKICSDSSHKKVQTINVAAFTGTTSVHGIDDSNAHINRNAVQVMCNIQSDKPADLGINLPSHIMLYSQLQKLILKQSDDISFDDIDSLLSQAQKKTQVTLHDESVKELFVQFASEIIIPRAFAYSAYHTSEQCGYSTSWNSSIDDKNKNAKRNLDILFPAHKNTGTIIIPVGSSESLFWMIQGMYEKINIIVHKQAWDWMIMQGEYEPLYQFISVYSRRTELADLLSKGNDKKNIDSARNYIVQNHTWDKNLEQMINLLSQVTIHPDM